MTSSHVKSSKEISNMIVSGVFVWPWFFACSTLNRFRYKWTALEYSVTELKLIIICSCLFPSPFFFAFFSCSFHPLHVFVTLWSNWFVSCALKRSHVSVWLSATISQIEMKNQLWFHFECNAIKKYCGIRGVSSLVRIFVANNSIYNFILLAFIMLFNTRDTIAK